MQQQQSKYRIISIKKRHPIFICKAIPIGPSLELIHPPGKQTEIKPNNLWQFKNHLKELNHRANNSRMNVKLESLANRSASCDLRNGDGIILGGREIQSRNKQLKSIKEYLRFAYKRNEREKRSLPHKLPDLPPKQQPKKIINNAEEEILKHSSDLNNVASMKKILKTQRKHQFRTPIIQQQTLKEESPTFRFECLSGWQQENHPYEF